MMRLLILANLRVLLRGIPAAAILVLFALIAGFVSSYLYYGNVPVEQSTAASTATADVEQFRFLPVLKLTDAELAELAQRAGIDPGAGVPSTLKELTERHDVDLVPSYESRARDIADRHGFEQEMLRTKAVTAEGVRYELAVEPTIINRAIVVAGADRINDGEVLLSVQHARLTGLSVGDHLTILGTEYRIAGTYYQPSDTLLGTSGDGSLGNATNAGVLMTAADFAAVDATEELIFVGRQEEGDIAALLSTLRDDPDVASTMASSDRAAMSSLPSNLSTSVTLMLIGTALFTAAILLVVWQVIRNNLRRSVAVIGVLKAMGLHPLAISASFAVYVLPVVLAVALGAGVGFLLAPGFQAGYLDTFNVVLPKTTVDVGFTLVQALLAVAVPFFVCVSTAIRLVRAPTLELLDGSAVASGSARIRRLSGVLGRLRLAPRVRAVFAVSNLPRLFIAIVSAGVAVLVLAFSLAISSMASRPVEQLRQALDFDHLVQYAAPRTDPGDVADVGYAVQVFVADAGAVNVSRSAEVMAVDPSFRAVHAAGSDGAQVFRTLHDDGIVVSAKLASDADLRVGDPVVLRPQALAQRVFTVTAVNPVDMDTRLYIASGSLPDIVLNETSGSYNTWFARGDSPPVMDGETTVTSRDALIAQTKEAVAASLTLVPLLTLIAVVLSVGVLFLVAYLNVFDNRRSIALLGQLGYQPAESLRLVINVYGGFLVLGAGLGALASPTLLSIFGDLVGRASDYHLLLRVGLVELAVIVGLVAVFAQLAHLLVLPWVRRISPASIAYA